MDRIIEESPAPTRAIESEYTPSEKISEQILESKINKYPMLKLDSKLNLFFDQKMNFISITPILPISQVDILFQFYKINHSKEEISTKIKAILSKHKIKQKKQKEKEKPKITDEKFIQDCIILSKTNLDGPHSISEKISHKLYGDAITYRYNKTKEGKNYIIAFMKLRENIYVRSDEFDNVNEAKLNLSEKIIKKYLPEQYIEEIMKNISETKKREELAKKEQKQKYEKFLEEANGDRKLLKKKRKLGIEEFSKRLPYFNMLHRDDNYFRNNSINNFARNDEEEITSEEFFINTENIPVDQILLGDHGIVENHLADFKYSPLKIFQMIKDSEKIRGVDFKIEYSQINDKKNYSHNNEVTILSQKLGIKTIGCGRSREEAANKCALNLLAILFKKNFKTYCELHRYFEKKNGRYLDIILSDENNKENNNNSINSNNNIESEVIIDDESENDTNENEQNKNDLVLNLSEFTSEEIIEI